ncbi:MAG: DMT family transporter [Leptolyngbyaceae bacterium]|nr:DMT family transporter [Leptolyngbyaceae bacterium]
MLVAITNYKGELAALSAALVWSVAALVYTRVGQQISASMLNLIKGLIAIALLGLTLYIQGNGFPTVSPIAFSLLLLSGVLGIGLGDTFYFKTLNYLGPRRTLLLEALAPPLAALLALVFLQEQLSLINWLGIGVTIAGVTWVVSERTPNLPAEQPVQYLLRGTGYGLLAALAQAGGAVLSRSALTQSNIDPLWSTLLRLGGGVLILLPWLGVTYQLKSGRGGFAQPRPRWGMSLVGAIALTAFFSTYLGIWLQQTALKYTATGVAQALSATSPLFILAIAIKMGEKVSLRAILGVFITLAGIALLLGFRYS